MRRQWVGVRLYRRLQQKGRWSEHQKDFCELKKTRYLKVRNLVLFSYGKMHEWGLTEIILFLSQLSGASNLCFSHLEFLRTHRREWFSLMAARSEVFFSFRNAFRAQKFTWQSLFTDTAGNTPFLNTIQRNRKSLGIWQGIMKMLERKKRGIWKQKWQSSDPMKNVIQQEYSQAGHTV